VVEGATRRLRRKSRRILLKAAMQRIGRQFKGFRQRIQGERAGVDSILTIQHFAQDGARPRRQFGK
jgi:hypothetical protein